MSEAGLARGAPEVEAAYTHIIRNDADEIIQLDMTFILLVCMTTMG